MIPSGKYLLRANIEHYEGLLKIDTDAEKIRVLKDLLAEAQAELLLLSDQHNLATFRELSPGQRAAQAKRWRMTANKCRDISVSCRRGAHQDTYLRLMRSYEALVKDLESV
jgi:hypothetical protein